VSESVRHYWAFDLSTACGILITSFVHRNEDGQIDMFQFATTVEGITCEKCRASDVFVAMKARKEHRG